MNIRDVALEGWATSKYCILKYPNLAAEAQRVFASDDVAEKAILLAKLDRLWTADEAGKAAHRSDDERNSADTDTAMSTSGDAARLDGQTQLATLRNWVADNLKGKQRRVVELLIDNNSKYPLADLANDSQISWQVPYENAWNSMRSALIGKLKQQGYRIERQDNEARLVALGAQK